MKAIVTSVGEPSDAAWRRFGDLAAAALVRLAMRDAETLLAQEDE